MSVFHENSDTIIAPATGHGGAIAIIRVSGPAAIEAVGRIFRAKKRPADTDLAPETDTLAQAAGYTVHFGEIFSTFEESHQPDAAPSGGLTSIPPPASGSSSSQGRPTEVVDEVLVTVFRSPHSYTGEDAVEISCHGSSYIVERILGLLIDGNQKSVVRLATAGEFTTRAFLAGKMDLSQAEAVADLIASTSRAGHSLAINQMRGGVSSAIAELRAELVELAALLELELDFGEEDVEFASRERLKELALQISTEISSLQNSFALGNAIKQGVAVAIVGRPNAGKSTLLNALVGDDRAMVSDVPGTTRDRIEERVNIGGVDFRFIDTAGLRATDDALEQMGIDRTRDAARKAQIVLLVVDGGSGHAQNGDDIAAQIAELGLRPEQKLCVVFNKADLAGSAGDCRPLLGSVPPSHLDRRLSLSAKTGAGLDGLREWLGGAVDVSSLSSATISSARHLEALTLAGESVGRVLAGLGVSRSTVDDTCDASPVVSGSQNGGVPTDLLAEDVRATLHHLGTITGSVTTDELLGTIFSRFCIGK